jgi:hypothetical protein
MTVLLRSRSLMRGIFHHTHQVDKDKDVTTTSCVSILHSTPSATFAEWEDDKEDDDDDNEFQSIAESNPATNSSINLIDDATPLEYSRRVALASSHGYIYDETLGVQSILAALTPHEIQSLSDPDMPLRHYRAEKGNVTEAIRKLKVTLVWRKEFEVEKIKRCFDPSPPLHHPPGSGVVQSTNDKEKAYLDQLANTIAHENATGKIYCRGYDKQGRAILYLTPGRENSNNELDNMRHLVYHLERAIACTQRKSGRSKVCIVIGYQGFTLSKAPPMATTRHTLAILQNHYPERMFRAYICDPPLVFRTFWSIIKHFVDPMTLEKIAFCAGKEGSHLWERDFDTMTTERQAGGRGILREFDSKEYLFDTPFDCTFDEKR